MSSYYQGGVQMSGIARDDQDLAPRRDGTEVIPAMRIPPYRESDGGGWRLERRRGPLPDGSVLMPGYWSPLGHFPAPHVLSRNGTVWMSTSLMETESQAHHLAAASGHVVVGGLGMGVFVYNLLQTERVRRVTVIEQDPELIEAFHAFARPETWDGWTERVRVVLGDATRSRTSEPVDFLYMDIWPRLGQAEALDDTRRAASTLSPTRVGYWGQEFDLVIWCAQNGVPADDVGDDAFRAWRQESGLPLIPDWPGYAAMAAGAVRSNVFPPAFP